MRKGELAVHRVLLGEVEELCSLRAAMHSAGCRACGGTMSWIRHW
jgi:hypothetical protein